MGRYSEALWMDHFCFCFFFYRSYHFLSKFECSNPKKDNYTRWTNQIEVKPWSIIFQCFSWVYFHTRVWYGWSYHTLYYSRLHQHILSLARSNLVRGSTCHCWCGSHQPSVQHHLFSGGLFAQPRHPVCGWGATGGVGSHIYIYIIYRLHIYACIYIYIHTYIQLYMYVYAWVNIPDRLTWHRKYGHDLRGAYPFPRPWWTPRKFARDGPSRQRNGRLKHWASHRWWVCWAALP